MRVPQQLERGYPQSCCLSVESIPQEGCLVCPQWERICLTLQGLDVLRLVGGMEGTALSVEKGKGDGRRDRVKKGSGRAATGM